MLIVRPKKAEQDYSGRWRILVRLILVALLLLVGRAVDLQVLDKQFLKHQGDLRHVGIIPVPAHRGRITDRNGELLAVSTPVKSIWVNPKEFLKTQPSVEKMKALAQGLGFSSDELLRKISDDESKSFIYVKRRMSPEMADQVMSLSEKDN